MQVCKYTRRQRMKMSNWRHDVQYPEIKVGLTKNADANEGPQTENFSAENRERERKRLEKANGCRMARRKQWSGRRCTESRTTRVHDTIRIRRVPGTHMCVRVERRSRQRAATRAHSPYGKRATRVRHEHVLSVLCSPLRTLRSALTQTLTCRAPRARR